jgi:DNA (cytosine-5)-methyltransferase 1
MDLGFLGGFSTLNRHYHALPFHIIWANEISQAACRTYRRNVGLHIHEGDIWNLIDTAPSKADVVIGGFPCQDISVNGKGAGLAGKRSGLYRAMVEMVDRTKPRLFVAENVKGLLMKRHSLDLCKVVSDFSDLGYKVSLALYNAADYGVPQTRERVFIVGTAAGVADFCKPTPTHSKADYITAYDAISDLANKPEDQSTNHIWSRASSSPDQGSRKLIAQRPGYTIRAECHGNIQWHYSLQRRISMREAARIQSFPDSFVFEAKLRETERQIGNAVPPALAWHVAQSAASSLFASTSRPQLIAA